MRIATQSGCALTSVLTGDISQERCQGTTYLDVLKGIEPEGGYSTKSVMYGPYSYLPSHRVSSTVGWYQIILLSKRHMCRDFLGYILCIFTLSGGKIMHFKTGDA